MQNLEVNAAAKATLNHLDQLYTDECESVLVIASESVESAATALRARSAGKPDAIAKILEQAAQAIREAHQAIEGVVLGLEEEQLA